MVEVVLTQFEYQMGIDVGMRRHVSSVYNGDQDVAGYRSGEGDAYKDAVEAGAAELAVAKYYGIYWDGSVDTYGVPDLLDYIDVKRCRNKPGLIVRPKDESKPEAALVAVTGEKGRYTIHGWQMRSWIIANISSATGGLDSSRPAARICYTFRAPKELYSVVATLLQKKWKGSTANAA